MRRGSKSSSKSSSFDAGGSTSSNGVVASSGGDMYPPSSLPSVNGNYKSKPPSAAEEIRHHMGQEPEEEPAPAIRGQLDVDLDLVDHGHELMLI